MNATEEKNSTLDQYEEMSEDDVRIDLLRINADTNEKAVKEVGQEKTLYCLWNDAPNMLDRQYAEGWYVKVGFTPPRFLKNHMMTSFAMVYRPGAHPPGTTS